MHKVNGGLPDRDLFPDTLITTKSGQVLRYVDGYGYLTLEDCKRLEAAFEACRPKNINTELADKIVIWGTGGPVDRLPEQTPQFWPANFKKYPMLEPHLMDDPTPPSLKDLNDTVKKLYPGSPSFDPADTSPAPYWNGRDVPAGHVG